MRPKTVRVIITSPLKLSRVYRAPGNPQLQVELGVHVVPFLNVDLEARAHLVNDDQAAVLTDLDGSGKLNFWSGSRLFRLPPL